MDNDINELLKNLFLYVLFYLRQIMFFHFPTQPMLLQTMKDRLVCLCFSHVSVQVLREELNYVAYMGLSERHISAQKAITITNLDLDTPIK